MAGDAPALTAALAEFVWVFDDFCDLNANCLGDAGTVSHVLNGEASTEVRRLVLEQRRRLGAFLTPHELAHEVVDPLRRARAQVTVFDPCCGAGDSLLAAARALEEPVRWGTVSADFAVVGIVGEFLRVGCLRFELLSRTFGFEVASSFRVGDELTAQEIGNTTHLLLNSPFCICSKRRELPVGGGQGERRNRFPSSRCRSYRKWSRGAWATSYNVSQCRMFPWVDGSLRHWRRGVDSGYRRDQPSRGISRQRTTHQRRQTQAMEGVI